MRRWPGCRASRLPLDGGVRAPPDLVRREPRPRRGEALARAIRDGKIGVSALFAQPLTGILDHETFARLVWPRACSRASTAWLSGCATGRRARAVAHVSHPARRERRALSRERGQPERAAPLLSPADAVRAQLGGGEWTTYPQLYWWEGPDGSRVLHWRADQYADGCGSASTWVRPRWGAACRTGC